MKCPYCDYLESKVIDTRPVDDGISIRRRRECLHCGKRFTTYETIERLPLMPAIFIHGLVLYISYLITYLINDWLEAGTITVLFFTVIFIAGYLVIWVVIYLITRHNTRKLNRILNEKNKTI